MYLGREIIKKCFFVVLISIFILFLAFSFNIVGDPFNHAFVRRIFIYLIAFLLLLIGAVAFVKWAQSIKSR